MTEIILALSSPGAPSPVRETDLSADSEDSPWMGLRESRGRPDPAWEGRGVPGKGNSMCKDRVRSRALFS